MRKYAVVGTGGRSGMYIWAMLKEFKDVAELVGLCDRNTGRAEWYQKRIKEECGVDVAVYRDDQFDQMLAEQKPDRLVVTTGPDRTHAEYIIRGFKAGLDVVTEKPMTTSETLGRQILNARVESGKELQVTFNYRYSPPRSQVREMILDGAIGHVLSVDFSWHLDTRHGADYFRRWHRRRENSGSLLVHKSTHHFDLVNWWLDDVPEEVFAHGSLRYYTPRHAAELGLIGHGERCADCAVSSRCAFYLDLDAHDELRKLYRENEHHDGYLRDRCVFSDEINIWDTMSVSVKYQKGAILNYMLHAYSPVEGYRIAFNGTKGRIEHFASENTYINGDGSVPGELERGAVGITYIPEFERPREVEPATGSGGHGGGDPVLLHDIFAEQRQQDRLRRRANQVDGTYSILVGVAAAKSIDSRTPVRIKELIGDAPLGERW
ncbi:MAG: Gfo/Idh/MocA family oxidoreductase [Spirochaetales bacterium]